jgi:hypothetical protein
MQLRSTTESENSGPNPKAVSREDIFKKLFQGYHPIPWLDSISRPIVPDSSVAAKGILSAEFASCSVRNKPF